MNDETKIGYKLTDQDMRTHGGFQWKLEKWENAKGEGNLCTAGWLHGYEHPLLAVLHNPIHGKIANPRLFRCEYRGAVLRKGQMKFGASQMRLVEEIPLPEIGLTQRVAYAILCASMVNFESGFVAWAQRWLSGNDRSGAATEAAWAAAEAAEAAAEAAWAAARAAEAAWAAARAAWAAEAAERTAEAAEAAAEVAWAAEAAERTAEAAAEAAWAAEAAERTSCVAAIAEIDQISLAERAMAIE